MFFTKKNALNVGQNAAFPMIRYCCIHNTKSRCRNSPKICILRIHKTSLASLAPICVNFYLPSFPSPTIHAEYWYCTYFCCGQWRWHPQLVYKKKIWCDCHIIASEASDVLRKWPLLENSFQNGHLKSIYYSWIRSHLLKSWRPSDRSIQKKKLLKMKETIAKKQEKKRDLSKIFNFWTFLGRKMLKNLLQIYATLCDMSKNHKFWRFLRRKML